RRRGARPDELRQVDARPHDGGRLGARGRRLLPRRRRRARAADRQLRAPRPRVRPRLRAEPGARAGGARGDEQRLRLRRRQRLGPLHVGVRMRRRVVVTGAGVVSPLGDSAAALHAALMVGRCALAPSDLVAGSALHAGAIAAFDPQRYLGDANFRPLDRTGQLATVAARLALDDAGLDAAAVGAREVGLVLGTTYGSVRTIAEFDRRGIEVGPLYVKPFDFANSVINAAAGQTAIWHQLRGPSSTVACGAASGVAALALAADMIASGRADVVLAGGAEELSFESLVSFARMGL